MKKILACTAIALSVSSCTSTLKDINGGLSTINNGLSTVNSGLPSKSIPLQSNNALITPSQQVSLQSNLKQKTQDKNIDSAISEASQVIADFITINSCITGYDGSKLNRYSAPGKLYPNNNYIGAPIPQMRHHNKSSCATVFQVHGWKMSARNALQFEVSYISDISGEVVKGSYEVIKQPNGEWLFTR
ncbi:MAG: hypothetical protein NTX45_25345 [Proteobacteria bacterium]|nr:hypothetical protein [Pseudomonadota bacterium]